MTPDREQLREKVARALREHMFGGIEEPVEGGWLLMADAVLAVFPQYEQVGWVLWPGSVRAQLWASVTLPRGHSREDAAPVYIEVVREADSEPPAEPVQRITTDSMGQPWNPRDQAILGGDPSL